MESIRGISRACAAARIALFALGLCGISPADARTRFRGAPKSRCETFLLTEVGLTRRVTGSPLSDGRGRNAHDLDMNDLKEGQTFEVGAMSNLNNRWALGGTLFIDNNAGVPRAGLKPRPRRWLGGPFSIDFSAGALVSADGSREATAYRATGVDGTIEKIRVRATSPAWMVEAALNMADYGAFTASYGPQQWESIGTDSSLRAGWKLGSYAAVGAIVAAGIGALILLAAGPPGVI